MSSGSAIAEAVPPPPEPQPKLSEMSRIVNVFIAPSATFTDIRRSASWWVPWLLMVVVQLGFAFAISQKIGWDSLIQQQIAKNPSAQAGLASFKPEQREQILHLQAKLAKYLAYAAPIRVVFNWAVIAAILLVIFRFGLKAEITFQRSFATWAYASMPLVISFVLTIVAIYVKGTAGNFDVNDPIPSNIAYFLDPKNSKLLYWLGSCVDVFDIWVIVLAGMGFATASNNKVKRTTAMAVFAILLVLVKGFAVLRG